MLGTNLTGGVSASPGGPGYSNINKGSGSPLKNAKNTSQSFQYENYSGNQGGQSNANAGGNNPTLYKNFLEGIKITD